MKIFNLYILTSSQYDSLVDRIDVLRETKAHIEEENMLIKKKNAEIQGQAFATYENWKKLRDKYRDTKNSLAMRESTIRNLMQENKRLKKKNKNATT